MKYKTNRQKDNVEACDYGDDFMILSAEEKQNVLETAKFLLKQQRKNSILFAGTLGQRENAEGGFA